MHFHNTAGFIYFFFSWIEIKSLNFPRESSASMLDKDGNIWIIGGDAGVRNNLNLFEIHLIILIL